MTTRNHRARYLGFECRRCTYPIPVFSASARGQVTGRLHVMCPQCGACERHDTAEASFVPMEP
jgi:hypothetical protein